MPRNPDHRSEAVINAEAAPLLSKSELAALSDDDFNKYYSLILRLTNGVWYARKGTAEGDRAYAAYTRLSRYFDGPLFDLDVARGNERWAAAIAVAAKKAATKAKRAATSATKKGEAGLVGSNYFSASGKVRLGDRIYVDAGDEYTVRGVALGSDPYSEKYATAMIAKGVPDKRNHRGDWAVIERGPDALLVSIGKGVKRNPRRRY